MERKQPNNSEERYERLQDRAQKLDFLLNQGWIADLLELLWENPEAFKDGGFSAVKEVETSYKPNEPMNYYTILALGILFGMEFEHKYKDIFRQDNED